MKTIAILYPYFGTLPKWFPVFFDSIKRNSTITFIFYSDCDFSNYKATNVIIKKISWKDYIHYVNSQIEFTFNPINSYKICDIRPLFGKIHYEDIKKFDFYGYGDIDVLFGCIRDFYTNKILNMYDVFSTHNDRLSGHFSLFKNTRQNREMYKYIGGFREKIEVNEHIGIDEEFFLNAYKRYSQMNKKRLGFIKNWKLPKLYLFEQYTTPFTNIPWIDGSLNSNQPDVWYYKNGVITNNRDRVRKFMYLHFMNFKSSTYRNDGTRAPWESLNEICSIYENDFSKTLLIDKNGIHILG